MLFGYVNLDLCRKCTLQIEWNFVFTLAFDKEMSCPQKIVPFEHLLIINRYFHYCWVPLQSEYLGLILPYGHGTLIFYSSWFYLLGPVLIISVWIDFPCNFFVHGQICRNQLYIKLGTCHRIEKLFFHRTFHRFWFFYFTFVQSFLKL